MNIKKELELIQKYTESNDFNKIKELTINIEKQILDNYKNHSDFKRLIDTITRYSDYSFFNTLLIDYQYPNFLDLKTENKYIKNGFNILDNAKVVNVLIPDNIVYVKVKNEDKEEVLRLSSLFEEELSRYNNPKDKTITFHHKELNGMNILNLYDCKDTTMRKDEYKHIELPALFIFDYNDIYSSFVKALYKDGYKIKYCDNLDSKFEYDKDTKTINIKNGLNNQVKIKYLLDVYSSDNTNNSFDKDLFKYSICKGIGITEEYDFDDRYDLADWYKNTDFKNVEHSLKLISSKGRKFLDNFNNFFSIESKNFEYETVNLYDNYNLTI